MVWYFFCFSFYFIKNKVDVLSQEKKSEAMDNMNNIVILQQIPRYPAKHTLHIQKQKQVNEFEFSCTLPYAHHHPLAVNPFRLLSLHRYAFNM